MNHLAPQQFGGGPHPPALPVDLRASPGPDIAYIVGSWCEAYKHSPSCGRMPWPVFKRHVRPELEGVLHRSDTQLLTAYLGQHPVGWIAFAPGRRVSTVHWVHTRYCVGEGGACLRKRGIMTTLLGAAQLGDRIVYTHRGPYPKHRHAGAKQTSDEWIVPWLRRRGVSAAYVPMSEWSR